MKRKKERYARVRGCSQSTEAPDSQQEIVKTQVLDRIDQGWMGQTLSVSLSTRSSWRRWKQRRGEEEEEEVDFSQHSHMVELGESLVGG